MNRSLEVEGALSLITSFVWLVIPSRRDGNWLLRFPSWLIPSRSFPFVSSPQRGIDIGEKTAEVISRHLVVGKVAGRVVGRNGCSASICP